MAKLTKEDIIASLKEMTVLELNDLVKAVEAEFGVTAAAPVAAAAPVEEEEGPAAGPTEVSLFFKECRSFQSSSYQGRPSHHWFRINGRQEVN